MNYIQTMDDLASRVFRKREELGLSRPQLAARIREMYPRLTTAASTIQSIENGDTRSPTILHELAQALGVSESWLKSGVGPEEAPDITAPDALETVFEAVLASYQMIGLPDDEAAALLGLVRKVVEEHLGKRHSPGDVRRSLTESATRRLLRLMRPQAI